MFPPNYRENKVSLVFWYFTAQKKKFSIKDFFSKCDKIGRKLRIWSHLLNKSLMENFNFCVVLGKFYYVLNTVL